MKTTVSQSFKIVVVGSSGVGKSAMVQRLIDGTFREEGQSTVGVEFKSFICPLEDQSVKLQIWDTAGQERFRAIAKAYFRSAIGVILVFDLTDRKSFDDLSQWLSDVHAHCDPNAVVMLIGNKSDLESSRKISESEAKSFAELHNLNYLETSARVGDNVELAFQTTAQNVLRTVANVKDLSKNNSATQLLTEENTSRNKKDNCNC